jgi:hypothetical protein
MGKSTHEASLPGASGEQDKPLSDDLCEVWSYLRTVEALGLDRGRNVWDCLYNPGVRSLFFFLSLRHRLSSTDSWLLNYFGDFESTPTPSGTLQSYQFRAPTAWNSNALLPAGSSHQHEWLRRLLQVPVQVLLHTQLPALGLGSQCTVCPLSCKSVLL